LSTDEQLAFNEAIQSTPYMRQLAVQDLITKFNAAPKEVQEAQGTPITQASAGGVSAPDTFANNAEYIAAMRGSKYRNNAEYRNAVIAKAKRSGLL
jgi:hypothetical protein